MYPRLYGLYCFILICMFLWILVPNSYLYMILSSSVAILLFTLTKNTRYLVSSKFLDRPWSLLITGTQLGLVFFMWFESLQDIGLLLFFFFLILEWVKWLVSIQISELSEEVKALHLERDQMNETFRLLRSERHDFLKHIASLHYMLEKQEIKEAQYYINRLTDGYEETNLSIKGERGSVAGILHEVYQKGKNAGIEMVFDLEVPISNLPMPDAKIVSLVGNLLTNSVEASEEWQRKQQERATVTLHFYKRSGLYLLTLKNFTVPIPTEVLDQLFVKGGYSTKAKEGRGLGTMITKDIVSEYNGWLDFVHKDDEFTVKVKFPAIQA